MTTLSAISSMATKPVLTALCKAWQASSGHTVQLESVGGVAASQRVANQEVFDVVFLASDALDKLLAAGHLAAGSKVNLFRSEVLAAIPADHAAPAFSTEADVRQAVLAAPSISYSTGPSGTALAALFARWGIAEAVANKLVVPPPGTPVGSLVASGQVALGFQQRSELTGINGLQLLGALPEAIAIETIFSAACGTHTPHAEQARDLLAFIQSPAMRDLSSAHGMAAL